VDIETRVELQVDAFLPTDYVRGEYQRIEIYKRIAAIGDRASRVDVEEELVDRFGDEPQSVTNLIEIAYLKSMCSALGIESVVRRPGQLIMRFSPHARVDGARLFMALHETDKRLSLSPQKPPSLILRDARLEPEPMLHEAVRLMEAVTAHLTETP